MPNIIKPDNHGAWLEARKGGIGSSEIATIVGLNAYESAYELWLRKTGRTEPKETTALMEMGHDMEPAVASAFARHTGRSVLASSEGDWLYQDEEHPHRLASPDRLYWIDDNGVKKGKTSKGNQAILECKSTQITIDPNNIPDYWYCQLQWQMGVGEHLKGSIAWITRGRDFGYVDVEFDPAFFAYLCQQADDFWHNFVLADVEPPLTSGSDVLKKYLHHTEDKVATASNETVERYTKLVALKDQIKALEEERDQLESEIKIEMLDAERLVTTSGELIATWRTSKPRETFDKKALAKDHPELIPLYTKVGEPSRTFLLK